MLLQKTVCDCCEINCDLPISDILRNQNEHKDDSDNKENDQTITQKVCSLSEENQYIDHLKTFACHKGSVKFQNSVMELSAVASEMSVELSSKREKKRQFSRINCCDYTSVMSHEDCPLMSC